MRPGMKHVITIMSFEGDERERVKRMIEESGAKLTTYLNRQNTVMVCKRLDLMKKKYVYAKEFNTPMVNVVWLSDLLLGNTSMISQYDSPKYQQYNLPQPLRIDHSILPQLMSKNFLISFKQLIIRFQFRFMESTYKSHSRSSREIKEKSNGT